jgi:hypothetical protein
MMILVDDSLLISNLYHFYILLHFPFKIYMDITHLINILYPIFIIHSNPGYEVSSNVNMAFAAKIF